MSNPDDTPPNGTRRPRMRIKGRDHTDDPYDSDSDDDRSPPPQPVPKQRRKTRNGFLKLGIVGAVVAAGAAGTSAYLHFKDKPDDSVSPPTATDTATTGQPAPQEKEPIKKTFNFTVQFGSAGHPIITSDDPNVTIDIETEFVIDEGQGFFKIPKEKITIKKKEADGKTSTYSPMQDFEGDLQPRPFETEAKAK